MEIVLSNKLIIGAQHMLTINKLILLIVRYKNVIRMTLFIRDNY